MSYRFKFKVGQKVLLRDDAEHSHQKYLWHKNEEEWATITEAYISSFYGGPWYRIKAVSDYLNCYPEDDLKQFGYENNEEAKELLSREW